MARVRAPYPDAPRSSTELPQLLPTPIDVHRRSSNLPVKAPHIWTIDENTHFGFFHRHSDRFTTGFTTIGEGKAESARGTLQSFAGSPLSIRTRGNRGSTVHPHLRPVSYARFVGHLKASIHSLLSVWVPSPHVPHRHEGRTTPRSRGTNPRRAGLRWS